MRSVIRRRAVIILTLAIVLVLTMTTVVFAATPANGGAGKDFGLHHAECAQTCGLNGNMNPGMHQGMYGWMGCPQR